MWHLQFMTYFYFETDLRSFIFADHWNIIWQQEKDKRKRCMPRKNKNWHRQGFSAVAKASRANGIWEWFRDGFLLVTEVRHFGGPIEIHVGGESDCPQNGLSIILQVTMQDRKHFLCGVELLWSPHVFRQEAADKIFSLICDVFKTLRVKLPLSCCYQSKRFCISAALKRRLAT